MIGILLFISVFEQIVHYSLCLCLAQHGSFASDNKLAYNAETKRDRLTIAPATTDEMKLRLSRTMLHTSQSGQEHLSRQPDITAHCANS